jgi:2-C-methyl-D-erythritol 4-phosphate cytidylyltransferase
MNKVTAVIVAAGQGTRFGGAIRKQYLELDGAPILFHTLVPFQSSPLIDEILLVVPQDDRSFVQQMLLSHGNAKVREVIAGGAERYHSVANALSALSVETGWVMIHDGVRPFITLQMISQSLYAAKEAGSAIVAVTPRDTVKSRSNNQVEKTLDRSMLLLAQTPQVFRRDIIERAYRNAFDQQRFSTDDAALVEQIGLPVSVVQGNYRNIKITCSDDLILARALMKAGNND